MARFRLTLGQWLGWVGAVALILWTYTASVRPERRGRTLLQVAVIAGFALAQLLIAWLGGTLLAWLVRRSMSSRGSRLDADPRTDSILRWVCMVVVGLAAMSASGVWMVRIVQRIGPVF